VDKIQALKGFLAAVFGVVVSSAGGYDALLKLYLFLIVVDFFAGMAMAIKQRKFSSSIAMWGFVNKVIALAIVALCVILDEVIDKQNLIRNIAVMWFSICEGASILEHLNVLGIPLPPGLRDILVQAKKGFSINISQIASRIAKDYLPQKDEEE